MPHSPDPPSGLEWVNDPPFIDRQEIEQFVYRIAELICKPDEKLNRVRNRVRNFINYNLEKIPKTPEGSPASGKFYRDPVYRLLIKQYPETESAGLIHRHYRMRMVSKSTRMPWGNAKPPRSALELAKERIKELEAENEKLRMRNKQLLQQLKDCRAENAAARQGHKEKSGHRGKW